jgi:regulator of protease activity HflC (stomatin/prohibitin superfamily)
MYEEPKFFKIFKYIFPACILIFVFVISCVYAQDVGEVCILRNWGGQLAGTTETAGFHVKAPWQSVIRYDIRNNIVNLYRNSEYEYDNGTATGAEVTVYDKSGAQANVDVQVIYSLEADAAIDLYTDYQRQENFVQIVAVNNVRDAARNCSGKFTTLQLLNSREEYAKAIYDKLAPEWEELGLHVTEVNVQDIRYSGEIVKAYNDAQKTEISKQNAVNEQEAEKVKIETQILKAQGEAEANEIRSKSLTPEILQQEYIEALKNGQTIYVVPEGGSTIVIPNTSESK